MLRRDLLKGIAAATALQGMSWSGLKALAGTMAAGRRVRPSDAAWPKAASWQKLNDAVGGNLLDVKELFAACEPDPKNAACGDVLGKAGQVRDEQRRFIDDAEAAAE